MAFQNKKILLAITGGIAAYKCANLVRLFIKSGAEVKVIMTSSAKQFVTTETLAVLSKNEVLIDFFDADLNWNNHVHLAEWADLMVIAPATANSISKFANGLCDNLLTAVYLSTKSKIFIAPAMDLEMYHQPSTQQNLKTLKENGNIIIPVGIGELASGLIGEGRMAEPEDIVSFIESNILSNSPLYGKNILVNAGPTYEAIDPVRFIGNRSSGKTGIAIADELSQMGANVTLVLGPSHLMPLQANVKVIKVESANEMFQSCIELFNTIDVALLSAAVADYSPNSVSENKIKKTDATLNIELSKTKDILAELGKLKQKQILVGFALETDNTEEYATQKLKNKNLDFIVLNTTTKENPAFGSDFNCISILDKHNKLVNFELKSKKDLAKDVVNYLIDYMNKANA